MAEIYKRDGTLVYQARFYLDGKRVRVSTGKQCPVDAQKEADRLEQEALANRIDPSDITLTQGADRFFRTHPKGLKARTIKEYTRNLVNLVEFLGDVPLRMVTKERIQNYISFRLKAGGGPIQMRRDLAFLSAMMTVARHWGCGVTMNPVSEIDKRGLPEAKSRNVWLRPAEVQKLIDACTLKAHKDFIRLAVHTGMRHQELLQLRWDEIDLKKRVVYLGGERTKNSHSREIALSQPAFDTLSDTPEHERIGCVFKGKKEGEPIFQMGKRWNRIRERAGMPHVRIHDLRHTFASWMKQRGVAETTIMDLMGHKTRSMVKRYSHDSEESRRAAVTVLDDLGV